MARAYQPFQILAPLGVNTRDVRVGGSSREATDCRNVDFRKSFIETRAGRLRYNTTRLAQGLDIQSLHFFRDENGIGHLLAVADDKIYVGTALSRTGEWTQKYTALTEDLPMTSVPFFDGDRIYLCLTNGTDAPLKYDPVLDAITILSADANLPKGTQCFVLADRLFIGPMVAADEDLRFEHGKALDAIGGASWSDADNFIQLPPRSIPKAVVAMGDAEYILTEFDINAVYPTGFAVAPFRVVQVGNKGTISPGTVKAIPGENIFTFLDTDGMVQSFDRQNRMVPIGLKLEAVLYGSDDTDYSGINKNAIETAVAVVDEEFQRYRLYVPNAGDSYNTLGLDYYYTVKLIDFDPKTKTGSGHTFGQWFINDADVKAVVVGLDTNNNRTLFTSSGKADITDGTVAITSGGIVTGVGTDFDQPMVGDDFFADGGDTFVVESVVATGSLTLTSYDGGTVGAGTSYTISRRGIVYQEDQGANDDGAAIDAYYITRWFDFGRMDLNKLVPEADIITKKSGAWPLQVNHMVDFEDGNGIQNLVDLTPSGAVVGTAIVGTAVVGSEGAVPLKVPVNTYGKVVRWRFRIPTLNQTFAYYGIIPYVEAANF